MKTSELLNQGTVSISIPENCPDPETLARLAADLSRQIYNTAHGAKLI